MKKVMTKLSLLVIGLSLAIWSTPASQAQLYFLCVPQYCSTRPATHPCWCPQGTQNAGTLSTCGQATNQCGGPIPP